MLQLTGDARNDDIHLSIKYFAAQSRRVDLSFKQVPGLTRHVLVGPLLQRGRAEGAVANAGVGEDLK